MVPLSITSGGLVLGHDQDAVGAEFDPAQGFKGCMADVRIYREVLSARDIHKLAN
jgi:hypothetical protein